MDERWLPVVGYEGRYEVSDRGRVRNPRSGHMKTQSLTPDGYRLVHLSSPKQKFSVHVLVALSFIGPRPDGLDCCHRDGDKENNSAGNIYYGTRLENIRDKARHGTQTQGVRHYKAKLTEDDVREIRARVANGQSQAAVARDYGVDGTNINRIVNYRTWKHVDPEMNPRVRGAKSSSRIDPAIIKEIRERYDGTVSQRALAEKYGISKSTIWYIINGITY